MAYKQLFHLPYCSKLFSNQGKAVATELATHNYEPHEQSMANDRVRKYSKNEHHKKGSNLLGRL
jgi:hypothetical protein